MKIAIAIPCLRTTEALFTVSLAGMVQKSTLTLPHELRTQLAQGTVLDARNTLVAASLDWQADWILWLDADQTFPEDTLVRLLAHGLDVVGCNYPRRRPSDAPTAVKDEQPLYTNEAAARAGMVEEVDSLGLGVCLMRTSIFEKLERPWFNFELKDDRTGHVSEDVAFFRGLKRAGITAHVDHALSWEVGHIHEQVLMNSMTRRGYVSSILPSAGAQ